jgi:hypothetical protein
VRDTFLASLREKIYHFVVRTNSISEIIRLGQGISKVSLQSKCWVALFTNKKTEDSPAKRKSKGAF